MKRLSARKLYRLGVGALLAGSMLVPLAQSAPVAAATPAQIAPMCPQVITNRDSGKTITMVVGTCATLELDNGLTWSAPVSSSSAVQLFFPPVPAGSTVATEEWFLRAAHQGVATVTSLGRPACTTPGQCPDFVVLFRVTIDVVLPPAAG
ncbi:MAG: hypothetical protein ACRDJU_09545 [Actinomycetota bacterium]